VILAFGEAARGARVRVVVHDHLGRARRHLVEGQRVTGEAAFAWDGRDDWGQAVPAGLYVARAETIPDASEPSRSGSLALTVLDR
jgi:flagellar hook assembly protein FlgD